MLSDLRGRARLGQRARVSLYRVMRWLEDHAERPRDEFAYLGPWAVVHPRARVVGGKYISIGEGTYISEYVRLEAIDTNPFTGETLGKPRLEIGRNVLINARAHVGCIGEIVLEDEVGLASGSLVVDAAQLMENPDVPIKRQAEVFGGRVVIRYGSVVAENAAVLAGVTVGPMSYIGANSVVTRDVPPYSIVAGSPARVLRTYDLERRLWTTPPQEGHSTNH